VGLAVDAIDHQIAPVVQFVGQPLARYAANDGLSILARMEDGQVTRLRTLAQLRPQCAP